MKKDGKQRLFEVMGRLDPSFKILNEDANLDTTTDNVDDNTNTTTGIDEKNFFDAVKEYLRIRDWSSEEAKTQIQKFGAILLSAYEKIITIINSTYEDEVKAKRISAVLKGSGVISFIIFIFKAVPSTLRWISNIINPVKGIKRIKIDFTPESFSEFITILPRETYDFGIWWLQLAIILLLIRLFHAMLWKGTSAFKSVSNFWNKIKNTFKSIFAGKFTENVDNEEGFDLHQALDAVAIY